MSSDSPGASRTTWIHVLSLTAFVPTSVRTDLVLGPVLLLAGDGLLMVVNGVRFALLGLRMLSTLCLASLDGMLAFLMRACSLLAFRSSLGIGVPFFGAHMTPPGYTWPRLPPTCFGPLSTLSETVRESDPSESGNACSSLAGRLLIPCFGLVSSAGPTSRLVEPTASLPCSS